jgi:hypothetical protein
MTEGTASSVFPTIEYRVIVPFLAGLLPFSGIDSLRIVSYLSLFAFYVLVLLTCTKLGMNIYASVVGLLMVFTSGVHLYNYNNPFLTDAFALMSISLMIYGLINRSFLVFATAAILGILAWEITIWLVPAWFLARDRLKGAILIAGAGLVFFIPRFISPSDLSMIDLLTAQYGDGLALDLSFFVITVVVSWGFIWALAPVGICLMPKDTFALVAPAFGTLLFAAFLYSYGAVDTFRYFGILAPVFAVSCAQLFTVLVKNEARIFWVSALILLVIAQAFHSVPNIIFSVGSWVLESQTPTLLVLILGVIYGLGTVLVLRKLLLQEVREKLTFSWVWSRNRAR